MDQDLLDHLADPSTRVAASVAQLHAAVTAREPVRIQTVNLHHLELAHASESFRRALLGADVITADGWPVVRTMSALGRPVERVTGSDLTAALGSSEELTSVLRVGLLGAAPAVGDAFASRLTGAGRTLAFREHGRYQSWRPTALQADIVAARLDLLLIAVTPPAGDLIAAELAALGCGVPIVPVGGSVDMLCGVTRKAPAWLAVVGAEWLFRFAQEPRRLFRRYFVGGLGTFVRHLLPVLLKQQTAHVGGSKR